MSKENFLKEVARLKGNTKLSQTKKYNLSVISDLENETQNTFDEIVRLQSELESYKDSLTQQYDDLYSRVFSDELNSYGDVIDQLIEVGINAPDFVGGIGKTLDDSIAELKNLKDSLNS